jgi:hypothetical protein
MNVRGESEGKYMKTIKARALIPALAIAVMFLSLVRAQPQTKTKTQARGA